LDGAGVLEVWRLVSGAWVFWALATGNSLRLEVIDGDLWALSITQAIRAAWKLCGHSLRQFQGGALPETVAAYMAALGASTVNTTPYGPSVLGTGCRPLVGRARGRWWSQTDGALGTDRGDGVSAPGPVLAPLLTVGRGTDVLGLWWEANEITNPPPTLRLLRNWLWLDSVALRFWPYSARTTAGRCWLLGSSLDLTSWPDAYFGRVADFGSELYAIERQAEVTVTGFLVEIATGEHGGEDDPDGDPTVTGFRVEVALVAEPTVTGFLVEIATGEHGGPLDPEGDPTVTSFTVEGSTGTSQNGDLDPTVTGFRVEAMTVPTAATVEPTVTGFRVEAALADDIDAPTVGEVVLWVLFEFTGDPVVAVRVAPQSADADLSGYRCLVRADSEDRAVDCWSSYKAFSPGATCYLDEPGLTVRVGVIKAAGAAKPDLQIIPLRESE
jgi:hypothetical protein